MDDRRRKLVLGSAALGLPYGLPPPGRSAPGLLAEPAAAALIAAAAAAGIACADTAPAYGCAEERLGRLLPPGWAVWSKLGHDLRPGPELDALADASLDASLARLRRRRIDLLQWHNWTPAIGAAPGFAGLWRRLAADPRVAALGCSTYGAADALAAVESGLFASVQVEWNLLNQGVVARIAASAAGRGVRIAVRSVLLQGVLAGRDLPPRLAGLAAPRQRVEAAAAGLGLATPALALAAALDHPAIDRVLIGPGSAAELAGSLAALAAPHLDVAALAGLDLGDDPRTDPRRWGT